MATTKTLETPRGEPVDLEEGDLDELREVLAESWQTADRWESFCEELERAISRREKEEG